MCCYAYMSQVCMYVYMYLLFVFIFIFALEYETFEREALELDTKENQSIR